MRQDAKDGPRQIQRMAVERANTLSYVTPVTVCGHSEAD